MGGRGRGGKGAELTLAAGGLSLLSHLLPPPLPEVPTRFLPLPRAPRWRPGELSPRLSAQRALCCCDGICEAAAAAAARLRARLGSARLGLASPPLRSPLSALRRAEPRASRSRCCGHCGCRGGCGAAVQLLLLEGAAPGPRSALPALTSRFPPPPSPLSHPGVPSEPQLQSNQRRRRHPAAAAREGGGGGGLPGEAGSARLSGAGKYKARQPGSGGARILPACLPPGLRGPPPRRQDALRDVGWARERHPSP